MNPPQQNPLTTILELSRRMLQQAEAGEWEDVVRQEAQRRQLIEQAFPLSAELAAAPATAKTLEQIIHCDNRVMELGSRAQGEAKGMLSKLQKGRRATNAYQKMSR
jgi:replicative DNA helicase